MGHMETTKNPTEKDADWEKEWEGVQHIRLRPKGDKSQAGDMVTAYCGARFQLKGIALNGKTPPNVCPLCESMRGDRK